MDSESLEVIQALNTPCAILSVVAMRACMPGLCQGELGGYSTVERGWSEATCQSSPSPEPPPCWKLYDKVPLIVQGSG